MPIKRAIFGILYEDADVPLRSRQPRRTPNVITFKSTEDLAKLPENHPAFPTVEDLVQRLITEVHPAG